MTEWCTCNKLKEAEEKAAKWDALVSRTAEMLSEIVAKVCPMMEECDRSCPVWRLCQQCGEDIEWLESEAE